MKSTESIKSKEIQIDPYESLLQSYDFEDGLPIDPDILRSALRHEKVKRRRKNGQTI